MNKPLDSRRGRKARAAYSRVLLTAQHYESVFRTPGLWRRLWPRLKKAKHETAVANAFTKSNVPDLHYFVPSLTTLILKVIQDRRLPKTEDAQIRFFVDAIAARGAVSHRRSIDMVQAERKKAKDAHRIVRCELYVVCSCGYEGPSLNMGALTVVHRSSFRQVCFERVVQAVK
jgi:hypothetical protein